MKTFTIKTETNDFTAHRTAQEAKSVAGAERFATAATLARLAAHWPAVRLVEIWNSLPGATPVRKFKDRATAVSRIWNAIQSLEEAVPATQQPALVPTSDAEPGAEGAPEPRAAQAAPFMPQRRDVAPQQSPANTSRTKKIPAGKKGFRGRSKTEIILGLLSRPGGVSLKQMMRVTGWQAHSVRGFISGTVRKKMGLTVVSARTGDGERSYSIKA